MHIPSTVLASVATLLHNLIQLLHERVKVFTTLVEIFMRSPRLAVASRDIEFQVRSFYGRRYWHKVQ